MEFADTWQSVCLELLKLYAHLSERVAMNITLTVDCVNACLTNVPEIDELGTFGFLGLAREECAVMIVAQALFTRICLQK